MNTFTDNQIQIITDLLIDNGLIFNEANNTVLINDPDFCIRITSIRDYCYHLYIDTINGETDVEFVLNRITSLLNKLAKYRESYEGYNKMQCGHKMYNFMNSFFDKTNEAFVEFFNTL